VHAVDFNQRLGSGISLETQALMSDISHGFRGRRHEQPRLRGVGKI